MLPSNRSDQVWDWSNGKSPEQDIQSYSFLSRKPTLNIDASCSHLVQLPEHTIVTPSELAPEGATTGHVSWEGHAGFHMESAMHVHTFLRLGLHHPPAIQEVDQVLRALLEAARVLSAAVQVL